MGRDENSRDGAPLSGQPLLKVEPAHSRHLDVQHRAGTLPRGDESRNSRAEANVATTSPADLTNWRSAYRPTSHGGNRGDAKAGQALRTSARSRLPDRPSEPAQPATRLASSRTRDPCTWTVFSLMPNSAATCLFSTRSRPARRLEPLAGSGSSRGPGASSIRPGPTTPGGPRSHTSGARPGARGR
jgi:hypothetical protein